MAAARPAPTVDVLLNLIDTRPAAILAALAQHPHLATAADAHGYALVHAAVAYAQLDVLRTLVHTYSADVNMRDEDGDSPLFAAETADVARCLIEELGADWALRNAAGQTAEEYMAAESGEANDVARYLRGLRTVGQPAAHARSPHRIPSLPNGVHIDVGTMAEDAAGEAPDPDIRRRIEELAARDDFQTDEVQRQLRELVSDVVSGIGTDEGGRTVRRRVG